MQEREWTQDEIDDEMLCDDEDEIGEDCGRWDNGRLMLQCRKAGSEECDWECPIGLPHRGKSAVQQPSMDRIITTDRDIHVPVGDGAAMTLPRPDWLWQLNHTRPEPNRGTHCDDRMLVVSSLQSYLYLVEECTKEEAWRRIKILREAMRQERLANITSSEQK